MYLRPDCDTFVAVPWSGEHLAVRLICDVYTPDGKPFEGDLRYILKRAVARARDMGFSMMTGPEVEFFLFKTDEEGRPTTVTHDRGGYFDLAPADGGRKHDAILFSLSKRWGPMSRLPITRLPRDSMKSTSGIQTP